MFSPLDLLLGYGETQFMVDKVKAISGTGEARPLVKKITTSPLARKIWASTFKSKPMESARVAYTEFNPMMQVGNFAARQRMSNAAIRSLAALSPIAALALGAAAYEQGRSGGLETAKRQIRLGGFMRDLGPMDMNKEQREIMMRAFLDGMIEDKE